MEFRGEISSDEFHMMLLFKSARILNGFMLPLNYPGGFKLHGLIWLLLQWVIDSKSLFQSSYSMRQPGINVKLDFIRLTQLSLIIISYLRLISR